MWRRALALLGAVGAIAVGIWWTSGQERVLPPAEAPPESPRATVVIEEPTEPRPPASCRRHHPRAIDFNGDGTTDWVYLDWVRSDGAGHAEFGWCIGDKHGATATRGMAETLYVFDLRGDGAHEALFGGNTCCETFLQIAVFEKGRVGFVVRSNGEPLVLENGAVDAVRGPWTVFGCDPQGGGNITQVYARLEGDQMRYRKVHYDIRGTTARVVGHERYMEPDHGGRASDEPSRGALVSETVGGCIEILDPGG